MKFLKQELDRYRGFDSVYIAAALTRVFGWEIRAQVVDLPDGGVQVLKAWAARSKPLTYIDIDGVHKKESVNPALGGFRTLESMTEKDLYSLAAPGGPTAAAKALWDAQVSKALDVVKYDLLMRLSHS